MTPTDRFDDDWPRTSRPAYSPGVNPIEQVFAKINAWLRRAERRSREAFWRSAGLAPGRVAPSECRNSPRNCSHARPR
jgi:transposase